ncbi:hypothetical protein V7S43_017177 [Phytophthora oleae]|uniref:SET domain-containing protein n=1 Tax=Phytophthora oleae TaxID=2107226 RepID=A0ABD3ETG2_9STRA
MQVECVEGRCKTRLNCGNQRMQNGFQSRLALRRVDGAGIGLFSDGVIEEGVLVAQYVGEVITRKTYEKLERQIQRATNCTMMYGMAVSATGVIDARCVGGMARFANHSCRPNCEVQKWEVAGKAAVGCLQCALSKKAKRSLLTMAIIFADMRLESDACAVPQIAVGTSSDTLRSGCCATTRVTRTSIVLRANRLFCESPTARGKVWYL